jgi:hypothetical protein
VTSELRTRQVGQQTPPIARIATRWARDLPCLSLYRTVSTSYLVCLAYSPMRIRPPKHVTLYGLQDF